MEDDPDEWIHLLKYSAVRDDFLYPLPRPGLEM